MLLATEGSESAGDFLTAISPRAALGFRGRRTTFQLDYRGSYQLYQELSELNAFDQRLNVRYQPPPHAHGVLRREEQPVAIADDRRSRYPGRRLPPPGRADGRLPRRPRSADQQADDAQRRLHISVARVRRQWRAVASRRSPGARRSRAWRRRRARPRARAARDGRRRVPDAPRDGGPGRASSTCRTRSATVDWRLDERLTLSGGAGYCLARPRIGQRHRKAHLRSASA